MKEKNYIAIVDLDQPNRRGVAVLRDDNDDVAKFADVNEIISLHKEHPLNVFSWWAFNVATGEAVAV